MAPLYEARRHPPRRERRLMRMPGARVRASKSSHPRCEWIIFTPLDRPRFQRKTARKSPGNRTAKNRAIGLFHFSTHFEGESPGGPRYSTHFEGESSGGPDIPLTSRGGEPDECANSIQSVRADPIEPASLDLSQSKAPRPGTRSAPPYSMRARSAYARSISKEPLERTPTGSFQDGGCPSNKPCRQGPLLTPRPGDASRRRAPGEARARAPSAAPISQDNGPRASFPPAPPSPYAWHHPSAART